MPPNTEVQNGTLTKGQAARALNDFAGSRLFFWRHVRTVVLEHALIRAVEENDDHFRKLVSKAVAKGALDKISAHTAKELLVAIVQSDTRTSDKSIEELGGAGVVSKLIGGDEMVPLITRLNEIDTSRADYAIGSLFERHARKAFSPQEHHDAFKGLIADLSRLSTPQARHAFYKVLYHGGLTFLNNPLLTVKLNETLKGFLDRGTDSGFDAFDIAVEARAVNALAEVNHVASVVYHLSQNPELRALTSLEKIFDYGAALVYHRPLPQCAPETRPEHELSEVLLSLIDRGLEEADNAVGMALAREGVNVLSLQELETVLLALKATGRPSAFDAIRRTKAHVVERYISEAVRGELLEIMEGKTQPTAPTAPTPPGSNAPVASRVVPFMPQER